MPSLGFTIQERSESAIRSSSHLYNRAKVVEADGSTATQPRRKQENPGKNTPMKCQNEVWGPTLPGAFPLQPVPGGCPLGFIGFIILVAMYPIEFLIRVVYRYLCTFQWVKYTNSVANQSIGKTRKQVNRSPYLIHIMRQHFYISRQ